MGLRKGKELLPVRPHQDDPFLWLEEVDGEQAMDWVVRKNAATLSELQSDSLFSDFQQSAFDIFDSSDNIPRPVLRGGMVYNFWQDSDHVRGLWRRITLEAYRNGDEGWENLLDVDALAQREGENWFYRGAVLFPPDNTRCLVSMSRGGKDAVVIREYDLSSMSFVNDGFNVPEAKSSIAWINEDEVLIATDFGPGSLTESGYPAVVKRWRRGQPLEDATDVLQACKTDLGVLVRSQLRPEGQFTYIVRMLSFWRTNTLLLGDDDKFHPVCLPDSADFQGLYVGYALDADAGFQGFWNGYALAILRDDWRDAQCGDVVALNIETDELEVLFRPGRKASASYVRTTRDSVIVCALENAAGVIREIRFRDGAWHTRQVPFDPTCDIKAIATDDFSSQYFVMANSFLAPGTLYLCDSDGTMPSVVKKGPKAFDSSDLQVEQHWVTSKDGTRVPYFLVANRAIEMDGCNAVLLDGYGGFEMPLTPRYDPVLGKLWLEQGGVYAVANIRGGGEFGAKWHRAALRRNRHKAFEDFTCVAEDLIARGITSPGKLGIRGYSNGGLLVGVMLTRRPDLFAGVICAVPLLDMLRYHTLLAGASWVDEYGDPEDSAMRDYIADYSPYQNVVPDRVYPRLFLTTSTNDDRVHPGHARKMAAKMEAMGHSVLYYENTDGGHCAVSDLRQHAKMSAMEFIFLRRALNFSKGAVAG